MSLLSRKEADPVWVTEVVWTLGKETLLNEEWVWIGLSRVCPSYKPYDVWHKCQQSRELIHYLQ